MEIRGAKVLLLEDDALISIDAQDMLLALGADTVFACYTLAEAEAVLAREAVDAAMLDVRIGSSHSNGFALDLAARGIPFIVTTGYGAEARRSAGMDRVPAVDKPYAPETLTAAFQALGCL